jgi:hypothetical protein
VKRSRKRRSVNRRRGQAEESKREEERRREGEMERGGEASRGERADMVSKHKESRLLRPAHESQSVLDDTREP